MIEHQTPEESDILDQMGRVRGHINAGVSGGRFPFRSAYEVTPDVINAGSSGGLPAEETQASVQHEGFLGWIANLWRGK